MKSGAVQKYYINAEYRSLFLGNLRSMTSSNNNVFHHDDMSKSRIEEDKKRVDRIVETLQNSWVNPFSADVQDELVCLSTSAAASSIIIDDLLKAKERGLDAYNAFKNDRIEGNVSFHAKMTKLKLKTFSDLSKKSKSVKLKDREIILKADKNLFSSILICAKSRALNMEEVFSHPLGPLPWSLSKPEGLPYKTPKSTLGDHVVKGIPSPEIIPVPHATIIDGMCIVNKVKGDKQTLESISIMILNSILHEGSGRKRIDVVFYVYKDSSIK